MHDLSLFTVIQRVMFYVINISVIITFYQKFLPLGLHFV